MSDGAPPLSDQRAGAVTPPPGLASNGRHVADGRMAQPAAAAELLVENRALRAALTQAQDETTRRQQALAQVQAEAARLQEALQQKQTGGDAWEERFLALQAEMQQLRTRWQRRYADEAEREKQRLLRAFLPFADHLQWAVEHGDTSPAALQTILNDLLHTLTLEGVSHIEAQGQPFDPAVHEAVSVTAAADAEPGVVLDVVTPGYRYQNALLRPARVRVSQ